MNHLSFSDLIRCTSISQDATKLLDTKYIQQRLINLGVKVSFRAIQDTFGLYEPKVAYVKTLADMREVEKDVDVLPYMMKPNVVFYGIEYYIGLVNFAKRVIKHGRSEINEHEIGESISDQSITNQRITNQPNFNHRQSQSDQSISNQIVTYLSYVLDLHPSRDELSEITGMIYLVHIEHATHIEQTTQSDSFISVIESLRKRSDRYYTSKFYPIDRDEYDVYRSGLSGERTTLHYLDRWYDAYIHGLIDGRHDALLVFQFTTQDQNMLCWNILVANGTSKMLESICHEDASYIDLVPVAINSDNLDTVRFLLRNRPTICDSNIFPKSKEMVDLLSSLGYQVDDLLIQIGAMINGDCTYQLKDLRLSEHIIEGLILAPGYIIQKYLGLFPLPDVILNKLMNRYVSVDDLYRVSLIRKMKK